MMLKWRGATRDFTFMFWIIANDCACLMIYPRMSRKQIELWGIKSTSGNFRPYQIQTANIHFNVDPKIQRSSLCFILKQIVTTKSVIVPTPPRTTVSVILQHSRMAKLWKINAATVVPNTLPRAHHLARLHLMLLRLLRHLHLHHLHLLHQVTFR